MDDINIDGKQKKTVDELILQNSENIAKKKQSRRQRKHKEKKDGLSSQLSSKKMQSARISQVQDYVIGPPKHMNYPDIQYTEDMNFNDMLKAVNKEDVKSIISKKYAQIYSLDDQTLSACQQSLMAPFDMFLTPSSIFNKVSSMIDGQKEDNSKLLFIAEDEMTGLGKPLNNCGKAISSVDAIPMSQVRPFLNSVAFNAKVMEKYVIDSKQKFPDYIIENSDADLSKVSSHSFIKWGSFCLSDQFDIYSDDFKKIIDANGLIQISSMTLTISDSGRVNYAAMFIYPYSSNLSAAKSLEENPDWEDYRNQPTSFDKMICRSDNMLNFIIDESSPKECTYTFKNSLPRLDPKKDYIFKIADWKCMNNLHLPLKSDLNDEDLIHYDLYQKTDDPCGAFYTIKTDNQKDFVFFNRIDHLGKYVHDNTIDNPFGQQIYISKIEAKCFQTCDVKNVISADYILMNDKKLTNEDGSKKVWKVSIVPSDYDPYYGYLKIDEV